MTVAEATVADGGPASIGRSIRVHGRSYPVLLPSLRDPRLHLASVVISLQVLGQAALGFQVSIAQILVAVGTAGALESGIALWRRRVILWPASALLTGNGVAFVLRVPGTQHGDWWTLHGAWIFAATAAVGLLSKYVIRLRGRHLLNPSNAGLVACFLILGSGRADPLNFWWGPMSVGLASAIGLIVLGGLAILSRLRMLTVAISFWLAFAAGLAVLALRGHAMIASWHLGPITGWSFWWTVVSSPEILVFLFFMITDPKTAPVIARARVVYAVGVGLLAAIFIAPATSEFATKVSVLGALAVLCACRPLVERLFAGTAGSAAAQVPPARWQRPPARVLTTVGLFAASVVVILVAFGGASAGVATLAPSSAAMAGGGPLPAVSVVASSEVSTQLSTREALVIARDLEADLALEARALRRRSAQIAASAGSGAWLAAVRHQIVAARGRAILVPVYRVRALTLTLTPGTDQAPPKILATLRGTVAHASYAPGASAPATLAAALPVAQTLVLALAGGRYTIVAARRPASGAASGPPALARGISLALSAPGGRSAPQGEPFTARMAAGNTGVYTQPTTVELVLSDPSGRSTDVSRTTLYVPGRGRATALLTLTPSQWFAALGTYRLTASVAGQRIGEPLAFSVTPSRVVVPRFADVTRSAGIHAAVPAPSCGEFSTSPAWGSIDASGSLDLFVPRLSAPAELLVNDGHGHFADEARSRGVAVTDAIAGAFGDYLGNGREDLFIARYGAPSMLFRNDGNGHFTDVTRSAGIAGDLSHGSSVTWVDYNGDGHLDLYVTQYPQCLGPWTSGTDSLSNVRYFPDQLYRNNGNGTFTNVSSMLKATPPGAGMSAIWFDATGNGRQDLYVGNDLVGPAPAYNSLWLNERSAGGTAHFRDVSVTSGTDLFMNTMGIAAGDFTRDGRLDLALSNIGGNMLLHNNGNATFTNVASSMGVARPTQNGVSPSVTWAVGAYDFTLDGWEDLFVSAGNINPRFNGVEPAQPSEMFVNDGGRRFLDVSAASGVASAGDAKGVAFGDYDRDGRMDMFVLDQAGSAHLYRNVTPYGDRHWLEVRLVGTVSNRDACGAQLRLNVAGATMLREVTCAGNQKAVLFGLGSAARASRLIVRWPSGLRQVLRDVRGDRFMTVVEPRR